MPFLSAGKSYNAMKKAEKEILKILKKIFKFNAAEKFIRYFLVKAENSKVITRRITTLFPADKKGTQDDFYTKEHPELLVFLETLKTCHITSSASKMD